MLSEEECKQISKILKKMNRHIWTEPIILKVIEILNQLKQGRLNRGDFFVPGILSYEDYLYNINLIQFI